LLTLPTDRRYPTTPVSLGTRVLLLYLAACKNIKEKVLLCSGGCCCWGRMRTARYMRRGWNEAGRRIDALRCMLVTCRRIETFSWWSLCLVAFYSEWWCFTITLHCFCSVVLVLVCVLQAINQSINNMVPYVANKSEAHLVSNVIVYY